MHLQTRKIRLKHEHKLKCIETFSERQNRKKHSVHRGDAFWSNVCKDLGVPNNYTNRKKLNHVALHYQKVSTLWYLCLESEYYSGLSIYQGEWQTFFKLWINYRAKVEWATEVCLDMKNSGWIIKIGPCTGTPKYNKVEGYGFTLQIDENVITTCVLNREPWKSYTNQKNIDVEGDSGTSAENSSALVRISKQNYMISLMLHILLWIQKLHFFKLY